MKKKNIAIFFGGMSAEYQISLQSAHAVIAHIDKEKYEPILIGITKQGQWFRYLGDPARISDDTWKDSGKCIPAILSPCRQHSGLLEFTGSGIFRNNELGGGQANITKIDAAFPVLHGTFGEDGRLQGLLELAGVPIVGCSSVASALCMNKGLAHKLAERAEIKVPRFACFHQGSPFNKITEAARRLGYPVFVKPANAGSSFGISKVKSAKLLAAAVAEAYMFDNQIVIEEAIEGFEVGCAIMGHGDDLIIGVPDEIELADGFFDFTEKYNLITSKIHVPARVSEAKTEEIKNEARKIYKVLGCSGFARIDMFIRTNGEILFNEVNTIPGFTTHSRYPNMMKAAGLEFETVVNMLIEATVSEQAKGIEMAVTA